MRKGTDEDSSILKKIKSCILTVSVRQGNKTKCNCWETNVTMRTYSELQGQKVNTQKIMHQQEI